MIGTQTSSRQTCEPSRTRSTFAARCESCAAFLGLLALIGFSCLNNFLGGAFMALMDAYGLSLMSVQALGPAVGCAERGLHPRWAGRRQDGPEQESSTAAAAGQRRVVERDLPVPAAVVGDLAGGGHGRSTCCWSRTPRRPSRPSSRRSCPIERQGRVFGFAQSVELAASPLTAFLIGPITQLIFIPFMTTGAGC